MMCPGIPASLSLLFLLASAGLEVAGLEAPLVPAVGLSMSEGTQQGALEQEAIRFARAWVEGDFRDLESMVVPEGIRLHIQGDLYPAVDLKRALAALRGFLGKYAGGELEVMRVSGSSGEEIRGFVELQWRTQIAGTGESAVFTLFVGFALEGGGWMVTEIRVLP